MRRGRILAFRSRVSTSRSARSERQHVMRARGVVCLFGLSGRAFDRERCMRQGWTRLALGFGGVNVNELAQDTLANRLVELRFKPLWLCIDQVREFCGFFARETFADAAIGDRVGLVVHELIENAIRFGDEKELELRMERTDGLVVIRVANTTTDENAKQLEAAFAETMKGSPVDAYANALKTAVQQPSASSGLGLPRIRCEGQVDLELELTPGRVCITARGAA